MKAKTIKELKSINCILELEMYIKKKENGRKFKKDVKREKAKAEEKLKLCNNVIESISVLFECVGGVTKSAAEFKKQNTKLSR